MEKYDFLCFLPFKLENVLKRYLILKTILKKSDLKKVKGMQQLFRNYMADFYGSELRLAFKIGDINGKWRSVTWLT